MIEVNKLKNIVVSDVRFQHEIDCIKKHNGIIIKIKRNDASQTYLNHISESGIAQLNGVNFNINNDSSKNDTFQQIDSLLTQIEHNDIKG